ncbi:MAG: FkbM family methyltransferase [Clostridia bacterium]|nr:FkbM family methyltransferase [Clostridia bacterium]
MKDLWDYLKGVNKPVVLYGTGNGADKILNELILRGITVSGVFASDGFVRNRTFRGFPVLSYNNAKLKFGNMVVLVCFGSFLPEVINNIKLIASENETYAPDVPVCEVSGVFDLEYAAEHKEQLEKVYNLLADDTSKKVFENIILYKITGKINYLLESETPKSEIYNILTLNSCNVYLDLGAYNGDTVAEFLGYNNCPKKIIALEPDIKNFKKLVNNTKQYDFVNCINAAVGANCGSVNFLARGGRNSKINSQGNNIPQISVDSLNLTGDIFIKMDIEGNESQAILGAEKTIKLFKPKMNIAAYHKNADMFELPLSVLKINPDYKVYLRHHPYLPAWDTNFYFI